MPVSSTAGAEVHALCGKSQDYRRERSGAKRPRPVVVGERRRGADPRPGDLRTPGRGGGSVAALSTSSVG